MLRCGPEHVFVPGEPFPVALAVPGMPAEDHRFGLEQVAHRVRAVVEVHRDLVAFRDTTPS